MATHKTLIVGVDTLAGSNIALTWADRCNVVGTSSSRRFTLDGCRTIPLAVADLRALTEILDAEVPHSIVYCQQASQSAWDWSHDCDIQCHSKRLSLVCNAAKRCGSRVIFVSSDSASSGPFLFRRDTGHLSLNQTLIVTRGIEKAAIEGDVLIARTHLFGWSPAIDSWAEHIWTAVSEGRPIQASGTRYATPILASDFAELLWKSLAKGLQSAWNLAGAERASMWEFAMAVANVLGLPMRTIRLEPNSTANDFVPNQVRFSQETSLDSRRIQSVLQAPLPRLQEGIARFVEQATSGYRDRIVASLAAPALVASAA